MIEMTVENRYQKLCREFFFIAYTIVEKSVTLLNMLIVFIHEHSTIDKGYLEVSFNGL